MLNIYLKQIKNNSYLIIPMICVLFWAFAYLLVAQFYPFSISHGDYAIQYYAGKTILSDPANLYRKNPDYYYLPSFATIFGVTISLLPLVISDYIFFCINIILGMLFAREYNKILILKGVNNKLWRFIFLMIISNGWLVYRLFFFNQFKYIIGIILFYIIRKEIQFINKENKKKISYYAINYGLFVFAVGAYPYLIFMFFIYIFYNINLKEFFKIENIKKYGIASAMFCIENILLFIFPSLIIDILNLYSRHNKSWFSGGSFPIYYLREFEILMLKNFTIILFISVIIMAFVSIILILKSKIKLENKFSYFSLLSIIFSPHAWRILIILLPFVILLYIPYINQEEKRINLIRSNKIIIIGLLGVIGIYFMLESTDQFIKYFPILKNYSLYVIIDALHIVFLLMLLFSIIYLTNLNKKKQLNIKNNAKLDLEKNKE